MQSLCILLLCVLVSPSCWVVAQGAGLNTATQSYEEIMEKIRKGLYDDPDHPTAVKTELEAVLDNSKCQILPRW